ncbi:MAG: Zn-ribbon domain-containing OB-fold protein [Acidimicrobiales bacterium]
MTALVAPPPGTPAPVPSALMGPYWAGCREGRLLFQRCGACRAINPKPATVCGRCTGRSLVWEPSAGHGSLYSWTIVWRPPHPSFPIPYAPAIVALDEGVRVLSAVIGCDTGDLRPDLALEVEFHPVNDVIRLPYFRPVHPQAM